MDPRLEKNKGRRHFDQHCKMFTPTKKEPEKIYFKNQPLPLVKHNNVIYNDIFACVMEILNGTRHG